MLHLLTRVIAALGVLLATICLAEVALAGMRVLRAERPRPVVTEVVPEDFWSALRRMEEQVRTMGLR